MAAATVTERFGAAGFIGVGFAGPGADSKRIDWGWLRIHPKITNKRISHPDQAASSKVDLCGRVERVPYAVENVCVSVSHRRTHFWTPGRAAGNCARVGPLKVVQPQG
jgi:hypothetical protein